MYTPPCGEKIKLFNKISIISTWLESYTGSQRVDILRIYFEVDMKYIIYIIVCHRDAIVHVSWQSRKERRAVAIFQGP